MKSWQGDSSGKGRQEGSWVPVFPRTAWTKLLLDAAGKMRLRLQLSSWKAWIVSSKIV